MTSLRALQTTILLAVLASSPGFAQESRSVDNDLRERSIAVLRKVMADESEWVKVHAAEHLLALGYKLGVQETFESELKTHGDKPEYRIGIWRVLAKAADSMAQRDQWIDRIRAAYLDPNGPDRLHAAETLAKMNYVASETEIAALERDAQSDDGPLVAFTSCILVHSGMTAYESTLVELLDSDIERDRLCAAYALRHIDSLAPATRAALTTLAQDEPADSTARAHILSAVYLSSGSSDETAALKSEILDTARTGTKSAKYEAIAALSIRGGEGDVQLLTELLEDPEADLRSAAAHALLRIERRKVHGLHLLDWAAIGAYITVMLLVGWYYARRTVTTEDYLLGGRTMRPLTVGLSMFATLLSTLTYLALPGEMIKHGPMIISQYLIFPVIFLVVGFVLIPAIVKQRVTSAYEILEIRLGLSVRILGSTFFLALRFLWMALIIYATSSKVLVPLLGWDASAIPYVCAVMGVVTVMYTSMGGLRAVVATDVVQTAILFGGAILTVVTITYQLGGVGQWWPKTWAPDWDPLVILFDPDARITVAGAMTSAFAWHVCTAGSDQVAIQRYLATGNASAARRVCLTSLSTDILAGVFLAVLGLALWAYFDATPHTLPDSYTTTANADTLFPRFIALALPPGISGLVIAGLLAAAMSSLSSGVNSSSSVITIDFLDRFRKGGGDMADTAKLRRAKRVSVFVGIAVILLSIGVGTVGGNLLEVVYRVVNLLVAPLFVLFFMALFVPWATSFGAVVAGLSSVAVAVGIAYGEWFGLSFIWIMPMALLTGIVVGPIVSLVPLGRRA